MLRPILAVLALLPATLAAQDDIVGMLRTLPTDGRVLAVNAAEQGRLTPDDPRAFGDGPPLQAWTIQPRAGQTVTIDLVSDDFDGVLLLLGPQMAEPLRDDDGGGRCNSRLTHTFSGGEYRIVVSSFSGLFGERDAGAFTLRASETPPPVEEGGCNPFGDELEFGGEWTDVTVEALNALPLAGRLRRGDSVLGTLDAAAPEIGGGRHGLAWEVTGPAGGAVTIDLASTAFDTYLYIVHANHAEPLTDDDAGGACNARLTVTLPESGRIRVVASSFGGGAEGPFSLGAYREPPPTRQGSCGTTSRFDANAVAALPAAGRVSMGGSATGELSTTDAMLDAYYADLWDFEGTAGQFVVIDLASAEFDAYLGLTGPGIVGAMTDDDSGGRCNSRLAITVPESGTFRIVVTTFRDGASGRYTLSLSSEAGPIQEGNCSFARESSRRLMELPLRGTLEVGGTVESHLGPSTPSLAGGSHAEAWELRVRAGEEYTVDLGSREFDTYLYAVAPDGQVLDDDDCGSGTDSRLVLRPTSAGRWRIVTSAFSAGEGPYWVSVTAGAPAAVCGEALGWTEDGVDYDEAPIAGQLRIGDEYRGELTRSDARHYDGSSMQAFEFAARAGERATIDLTSDAFDAYLIVLGRGLDNDMLTDDDSGGRCNSRVSFTVPETGTYRIVVNTLLGDQYGPYVLRVSAVEGPVAPGPCDLP